MNFADLYRFADGLDAEHISVKRLTAQVKAYHKSVGEVLYWPVLFDQEITIGHLKYEIDRSSAYEEEFFIANIRYHRDLDREWRRLVCCKELMHVFDTTSERVDTRERFIRLLSELESSPMKSDTSDMLASEREAMWMAALVLCPAKRRSNLLSKSNEEGFDIQAAATALGVPAFLARVIFSDYYVHALERLTGESLPPKS